METKILDYAGCPSIDDKPFNSTIPGYSFLQVCSTDIRPPADGIVVDVSTSLQTSFQACMDACARYNQDVKKGGCAGASWIIFSPTHPDRNSKCFLKSDRGVATSDKEQVVASGLLREA